MLTGFSLVNEVKTLGEERSGLLKSLFAFFSFLAERVSSLQKVSLASPKVMGITVGEARDTFSYSLSLSKRDTLRVSLSLCEKRLTEGDAKRNLR